MREEKKSFTKRENNIPPESTFNWPANPPWKEPPNYKHQLTSPALCLNSFKLISTDLQSGVVIVWCVVSCLVGMSNSSKSLRIPYHSLVLGSLNVSVIFFMVSPLTSKKYTLCIIIHTSSSFFQDFFTKFQVFPWFFFTKFQVFPSFFTKFQVFTSFFYKIPGFSRFYGHTFSNTWLLKV